jgi:hypothetical protein
MLADGIEEGFDVLKAAQRVRSAGTLRRSGNGLFLLSA